MEQAQAREKLWTPGSEGEKASGSPAGTESWSIWLTMGPTRLSKGSAAPLWTAPARPVLTYPATRFSCGFTCSALSLV